MVVKLIIFDLDGVLTASRDLHFHALNNALSKIDEKYVISLDEHHSTYDGLSTNSKLKLLTQKRGLSPTLYSDIWKMKQQETIKFINDTYTADYRIIKILQTLKEKGYGIYVASNAIYETVKQILVKRGFIDYVDYFISNQEVTHPKPSPEMYLKCIIRSGLNPCECVILEDSPVGRKAALNSGCHVMAVSDPYSYTVYDILDFIDNANRKSTPDKLPWNGKLNILIPMAGAGSRFEKEGYKLPKPLIEVTKNTPMIKAVVDNLNCDPRSCRYIFVVQKSHYEKYNLNYILNLIAPGCIIIQTDGLTQGAACTCLLAKDYIDNQDQLLFANSDQILEWDVNNFLYSMLSTGVDGGISTFTANDKKWSYVKLDKEGFVSEVAEKKVISNKATTGIYYFKRGSDFVKYAEQMISQDCKRVNGEFYVCPVFNEMITDGKKIRVHDVIAMHSLGVPEDHKKYLAYLASLDDS